MAASLDLEQWVEDAVRHLDGAATIVDIAQHIWTEHEAELRDSGDLFYTWQYKMRWSANQLRRNGVFRAAELSPRGVWELTTPTP